MSAPFPVFIELAGRRCLVVGASTVGEAKIQSLLASGALVRVVAASGTPLIEKWARDRKISWEKRPFHPDDLKSTFFVVAATSLQKSNETILHEAQKRGILCSVADAPHHCDFYLLLEWLPQVQDPYIKETIVRALSIPSAKPFAAPVLIQEFRKADNSQALLKLAIGNALSVVADDSVLDDILELAQETKHGKARQPIVLALGNMQDPRAAKIAIQLLNDEMVAGHAIMVLGVLRVRASKNLLVPFLQHSRAWIRKEARRAIQRIDASTALESASALNGTSAKKRLLRSEMRRGA